MAGDGLWVAGPSRRLQTCRRFALLRLLAPRPPCLLQPAGLCSLQSELDVLYHMTTLVRSFVTGAAGSPPLARAADGWWVAACWPRPRGTRRKAWGRATRPSASPQPTWQLLCHLGGRRGTRRQGTARRCRERMNPECNMRTCSSGRAVGTCPAVVNHACTLLTL